MRYGVPSAGGHGPSYLKGIGFWGTCAKFDIIVCKKCGLTEFFVEEAARERLNDSYLWEELNAE